MANKGYRESGANEGEFFGYGYELKSDHIIVSRPGKRNVKILENNKGRSLELGKIFDIYEAHSKGITDIGGVAEKLGLSSPTVLVHLRRANVYPDVRGYKKNGNGSGPSSIVNELFFSRSSLHLREMNMGDETEDHVYRMTGAKSFQTKLPTIRDVNFYPWRNLVNSFSYVTKWDMRSVAEAIKKKTEGLNVMPDLLNETRDWEDLGSKNPRRLF
jgi:hypothetical protein